MRSGEKEKEKESNKTGRSRIGLVIVLLFGLALIAGIYLEGLAGIKNLIPFSNQGRVEPVQNLSLGSMTINLAGEGLRRYVRVDITLEYRGKGVAEEITGKQYQVRETIIKVMRQETIANLEAPGELDRLKQNLKDSINAVLIEQPVTAVYFETFLVQ